MNARARQCLLSHTASPRPAVPLPARPGPGEPGEPGSRTSPPDAALESEPTACQTPFSLKPALRLRAHGWHNLRGYQGR